MGMSRVMGLFAVIPATVLLTISFFVVFALRKLETGSLKVFGYFVAALLWLATLLVFSAGLYTISTGRAPMRCMMQEMMQGKMHKMMMNREMPAMMPR